MHEIQALIRRHRAGEACGITSVCSAHPLVVEAALRHTLLHDTPMVLFEATCNQVNQDGGYTGMRPAGFVEFVHAIADQVGLPRSRIVFGGDHLGPNPWTSLAADAAMDKAEAMVDAYVAAGFHKIHLDCSMACAGDPVPLPEAEIVRRAVRLCLAAEAACERTGSIPPVYVIGTEVPTPGGAPGCRHFGTDHVDRRDTAGAFASRFGGQAQAHGATHDLGFGQRHRVAGTRHRAIEVDLVEASGHVGIDHGLGLVHGRIRGEAGPRVGTQVIAAEHDP